MNHAQKYLAQANRQIAELAVQVARQRVIVKHAFDTGQGSEMAESLLDALEGSLRIFEKHRIFLLNCSGSPPLVQEANYCSLRARIAPQPGLISASSSAH